MSQHEGNGNARDDEQMSHVHEDTIALLALGESVSTTDDDHVRSCVSCQAKVDQLGAIAHSARAVTDEDKPVAPPDELWDRIAMEIDSDERISQSVAAPRGARFHADGLNAWADLLRGLRMPLQERRHEREIIPSEFPSGDRPGHDVAHMGNDRLLRAKRHAGDAVGPTIRLRSDWTQCA